MSKRLRHAGKAVRRDYVRQLEYQLRSFREVNDYYRQALARAENTIQLRSHQRNMWQRHFQAERKQISAIKATVEELQHKNMRLEDKASKAERFADLVFMESLADDDGYSQMVH